MAVQSSSETAFAGSAARVEAGVEGGLDKESQVVEVGPSSEMELNDPYWPADAIICPLTHEIVSLDDVDAMASLYERIVAAEEDLRQRKQRLREAFAARTEGTAKTRRVEGRTRRVKVEMPDESFEQSVLKEAWHAYPQHRDRFLKIDSIGLKKVEVKKLMETSGEPSLNAFRDMVRKANRGPLGLPSVKVEV